MTDKNKKTGERQPRNSGKLNIANKKNNQNRKSKVPEPEPVENLEPPEPRFQRIFLYVHLEDIHHLPETNNELMLRLEQSKNTITQLVDVYTASTDINLTKTYMRGEPVPTFSVMIDQDSIEDLNIFSDNPLLITLYEYIPPYEPPIIPEEEGVEEHEAEEEVNRQTEKQRENRKQTTEVEQIEEESEEGEQWIPLAQGHLDMLHFFGTCRDIREYDVFIYPLKEYDAFNTVATLKSTWNVYSLLPLLKKISYNNLTFITLESIYQTTDQIMQSDSQDLAVDLSFQSRRPNEKNEFDKIKICTFSGLTKEIISIQNANIKWETIKRANLHNVNSLGIQFGSNIDVYGLFQDLVKAENTDFRFQEIDVDEEMALVCNSVHRYVLTKELCAILEEVVAFNEQHILLEVYRIDYPEDVLLQGVLDLSIFSYPRVNSMRFAVELSAPPGSPKTKKTSITKGSAPQSRAPSPVPGDRKTRAGSARSNKNAFAIVSIGLLVPLSEQGPNLVNNSENAMQKDQLHYCTSIQAEAVTKSQKCIREETYNQYDEIICSIIEFIIRKNVKSVHEFQNYFCCQMSNMINKVTKLIAYDFNLRVPTDNNIDFTNLMTTVYAELMQRHYNILKKHDDLNQFNVEVINEKQNQIVSFYNVAKYLFEVGDDVLAKHIIEKITNDNPDNSGLNFYKFIYDIEKMDYSSAKTYPDRPIGEKVLEGEYFTCIAQIYLDYMEQLKQDETVNEAYEKLLVRLQEFLNIYPLEIDCWVLLYCLYKSSGYLPGMSYTRWKYENLFDKPRKTLPLMPKSRWEIYNENKLNPTTKLFTQFNIVMEIFLNLGFYKFAEIIFVDIAAGCTATEKYFILTTLKILQNEVEPKYTSKQFPTNKLVQGHIVDAFQRQVNGNLEFHRDKKKEAMLHYEAILSIPNLEDFESFQLGILRYGYYMLEEKKFENAINAFEKCTTSAGNGMIANIGLGRAMYWLGRLEDAEHHFAEGTKYQMHVPDAWAYLALINMKMGNNFKALESWKYAKIHPDAVIADEILDELDKIDYSTVDLYVDKPSI